MKKVKELLKEGMKGGNRRKNDVCGRSIGVNKRTSSVSNALTWHKGSQLLNVQRRRDKKFSQTFRSVHMAENRILLIFFNIYYQNSSTVIGLVQDGYWNREKVRFHASQSRFHVKGPIMCKQF